MKRIIALMLALSMLSFMLFSCSESKNAADDTETEAAAPDDTPNAAGFEEETEPPDLADLIEKKDFEGYGFRILNNISNFAYTNIGEEGLTGEALDDAVFNRNKTVEDLLNITFKLEKREVGDTNATMQKLVAAGQDEYDVYTLDLNMQLGIVSSGGNIDAATISTLDFDSPWWNRQAIDSIAIDDSVYCFFGDLHTGYFESHAVAVFNKIILNNLNLADPYEHVYNNTWTMDNMITMMDAAKIDMNGDGKWTVDDQYGFSMFEGNFSTAFTVGGYADLIERDESGYPVFNGLSERFVDIYNKVAGTIFSDRTNNAINARGSLPGSLELYRLMFIFGRSLFLVTQIGVLKDMRDVDFELGVVPMPKFDEEQPDYRSLIFQGANAVGIPITNPDPDRTGLVLEHMAARSTGTVRDVYLNQTLDFKYIQDRESQEMMDIILNTGLFELASVYGWGGLNGTILDGINSGNINLVSKVARFSKAVNNGIQKTIAQYEKLKDR
ncbi:MAG: hypothetical protein IKQ92_08730 [Clostridia bacterium]|nr:hypothetical protein [Clostridia bacterium]